MKNGLLTGFQWQSIQLWMICRTAIKYLSVKKEAKVYVKIMRDTYFVKLRIFCLLPIKKQMRRLLIILYQAMKWQLLFKINWAKWYWSACWSYRRSCVFKAVESHSFTNSSEVYFYKDLSEESPLIIVEDREQNWRLSLR